MGRRHASQQLVRQADRATTWELPTNHQLTLAVTLGLPSRSPPIQEPKRMGQASMGSSRPVCFFSEPAGVTWGEGVLGSSLW